ncbi:hypothetical protein ACFV30_03605 [Streptomyces sp. NPDC059752]|uniref:hypothetical protein n=1 Tax=unclassified Streptomyces TaxID=2593676 RepID=UPI0036666A25
MITAAQGEAADYLKAVWQGVMAVVALSIAFNVRDVAYRIFQYSMDRSPVTPGAGFSPTVIRLVTGFAGVFMTVSCVRNLLG